MDFDFAFGRTAPILTFLGLGRSRSSITVDADRVTVKMGWSFHATIPRANITAIDKLDKKVLSVGVHGWGGRWLVNGAGHSLVQLTIDPETKARVVIPVRLRQLTMSVEDRDGLLAALS